MPLVGRILFGCFLDGLLKLGIIFIRSRPREVGKQVLCQVVLEKLISRDTPAVFAIVWVFILAIVLLDQTDFARQSRCLILFDPGIFLTECISCTYIDKSSKCSI